MAMTWRCNWCGRKQPADTLDRAVKGEHVARYFGFEMRFPTHDCSPEHAARTREYLAAAERWLYPFTAATALIVVAVALGAASQSTAAVSLGLLVLGILILALPLVRNTVKLPAGTRRKGLRWMGDVLLPNATPGDLLMGWRTAIILARVTAVAVIAVGLLGLLGVLR